MLHFETIDPSTLELLIALQNIKGLNKTRLVGGTSLALQIGHRISVDLDFFAYNLQEDFLSIIASIKNKGYKIEIRKQSSNILIAMIDNVKVDIVNYPYPWIDNEICEKHIIMASDKDIAAMKLSAITNRGSKKDFIDLYYLLKKYSLEQILSFYSKKYNDGSDFMVLKSLTYFDDAEIEASPLLFDKSIAWENIKEKITSEVKKLI
jgi:hypothetical protein